MAEPTTQPNFIIRGDVGDEGTYLNKDGFEEWLSLEGVEMTVTRVGDGDLARINDEAGPPMTDRFGNVGYAAVQEKVSKVKVKFKKDGYREKELEIDVADDSRLKVVSLVVLLQKNH